MKQQKVCLIIHFDEDKENPPHEWDWDSLTDSEVKVEEHGPVVVVTCFDCDCTFSNPIDRCVCDCHDDLDDGDYEAAYEAESERRSDVQIGRYIKDDLW